MICACLVGLYASDIPTSPKHSWNVFMFIVIIAEALASN